MPGMQERTPEVTCGQKMAQKVPSVFGPIEEQFDHGHSSSLF